MTTMATDKPTIVRVNDAADEVVDVFFEEGWDNWTRFQVKRAKGKVFLTKIGGRPDRKSTRLNSSHT